ncbi:hypothetical protein JQV27_02045 [Sulfitobacter mediterraneus]|jgi:hypothetical protein|uniref:hypothetical protein n=1 Tax=Sulfitobacter TaxID=60136 RepID=UPI001933614F|nr:MULTISPECIES: hypothetical protein [Sulfitobacter]MBM1631603.1 hypothetical protein [Sulfitobacter mediterraneus]MBM1639418.1 hypothetical protein [Sulfitobacter mediterraneus]MBM1643467.1 hypothetical protein [Sulfitobacter mediterraneus]MBM1647513.1 hypothetical protein [Sulfitobacter mediterraneus]MBM1651558.1 hypothetical protein [Sulfitobacter mediterraneus]
MAISTTTFAERIGRIEKHQSGRLTVETCSSPQLSAGKTRRTRFTFPFFFGVGILTGGSAYAWVVTRADPQWVMVLTTWTNG